jgi:hypothetical protein
LHCQVGRAMGQDSDEVADMLQLLNRAAVTPALIMMPDALANLHVANVIGHQVVSEAASTHEPSISMRRGVLTDA